jgi:hypothetical protein
VDAERERYEEARDQLQLLQHETAQGSSELAAA